MELERLQNWLRTYPGWEDTATVGSIELFPLGYEELWRKADALGDLRLGGRYRFALYWRAAGSREENDRLVLDFQNWVWQQSAAGLAPAFGDVPDKEWLQARNGSLKENAPVSTYTVTLVADFVKRYAA